MKTPSAGGYMVYSIQATGLRIVSNVVGNVITNNVWQAANVVRSPAYTRNGTLIKVAAKAKIR